MASDEYGPQADARWRTITALVLSIAGFGDSLYLTIEHYTGNSGLICNATSTINCLKVTTSSQSMVFGIFPVALLGLLFFVGMLVVNLPVMWRAPIRLIPVARLAMVVIGMGFVVYLLYSELFSIKAICLWCTGVHVVTFLLFVLVVSSQATLGVLRREPAPA
ncbi:MAG: vitamin K epoxide reductase family protein [Acidimicrobiales bacterium]